MFHRLLALLLALCLAPLALAADARGPTGALQGVRIQSLAVDPAEPDTLCAGSTGGGLFRSGNGGAPWAAANNGLSNNIVLAVMEGDLGDVLQALQHAREAEQLEELEPSAV